MHDRIVNQLNYRSEKRSEKLIKCHWSGLCFSKRKRQRPMLVDNSFKITYLKLTLEIITLHGNAKDKNHGNPLKFEHELWDHIVWHQDDITERWIANYLFQTKRSHSDFDATASVTRLSRYCHDLSRDEINFCDKLGNTKWIELLHWLLLDSVIRLMIIRYTRLQ